MQHDDKMGEKNYDIFSLGTYDGFETVARKKRNRKLRVNNIQKRIEEQDQTTLE